MRRRITGLVVLVVLLAGGYYLGRPFLQGYLAARRESVPPAVVKPVAKVGTAGKTPVKTTGRQGLPEMEKQYPALSKNDNPPPQAASAANTASGESRIDVVYLAELNRIGRYYQGQLNALVSQAYQSYLAVKDGKSHTPLLTLAGEYMGKGEALQKESDTQFYSVLDQYKAALQKAGLPTTYEQRAATDYETAKAAERRKILSAAEQYLK
jgi:hypothetical protein